VFVQPGEPLQLDFALQIGPLEQAVVVTAEATPVRASQTGAPVTVLDGTVLDSLNETDVIDTLRLVPGTHAEQIGGRGGVASLFIRGGTSSFAKVLIDGVAANDIGGFFDFGGLSTTGVDQIEVLRQTNSVLYGSDALSGVVSIATRRGRARVPELTYSLDGGNLGTIRTSASVGGAYRRLDYFSEYSYLDTDNRVPNNQHRQHAYAGRFGIALARATDLHGTLRWIDTATGSPNGFAFYGIADDSSQDDASTYAGLTAQSQWSDRWQSTIRFGWTDQTSVFTNPTPTGTPFDPFGFGANYLGDVVTLTGANGYSTTGRAILDFGGVYPSLFDSRTTRRALSGTATYTVSPAFAISGGGRVEREQGFDDPEGEATAARDNGGVFVEGRGSFGRTYVSAGIGVEHNEVFETAATPRLSVATYLREPAAASFGETKLMFNVGKGIKAPSVFQEQSSLFAILAGTPTGASVEPIGPERSRTLDVGVEQGLVDGQLRLRLFYFHNRFEDLIEFVSQTALPQVGVPPDVAAATDFGAYVNSSSYTAQGVETSAEALLMSSLRLMASYTFTDAEVTDSFASSALAPAFNPSIPGVPIGAFSPLVGQRPFRRPTHSGSLMASYARGAGQVTLAAHLVGERDGSTFLSDEFFGNSMLLPNHDLEEAYQKVDLSGAYRVHPRLKLFASFENLFDQEYESSFGFPSLPFTARVGVSLVVGGDELTRTP
jgi:iron complex outermembrane receptor protein/vitamin B12 transporter